MMIFTEELSREMGLYSLILVGPSTFGMRIIKEALMLWRQTSSEKKAEHSL